MAEGTSFFKVENAAMYKMKVAVALACLRNKPSCMSGQEYAKQLSNKFQTSQFQLQQKLKKTEAEMLYLQQELALYRQTHPIVDDTATESSVTCSQSQPLFPTPPPSGNPNNSVTTEKSDTTRLSLSKHTTFLHQVITLQAGSKMIYDKSMETLVHKSLLHSLDLIKQPHTDCDYVWKLQTKCIDCLSKVLKDVSPHLKKDLITKTVDVAEEIINRVTQSQHLSPKERGQQSQLLQQLGTNSFLCCSLAEKLCHAIGKFSNHLRDTLTDCVELDPLYFNNMYSILETLDACVTGQDISVIDTDQRKHLVQQLEDCTMYLSNSFPLFTLIIWRLCCKLST